jgi:peptide/nickel transport system substrate-binding protein
LIGAASAEAADVKRGGTLTVARPDEPLTLDPFIPSDNGSIYAIAQICEPLVAADKTGQGLEPGLAESWEISSDGLTTASSFARVSNSMTARLSRSTTPSSR